MPTPSFSHATRPMHRVTLTLPSIYVSFSFPYVYDVLIRPLLIRTSLLESRPMVALDRVANQTPEDQFQEGEHVWLEAKNLALPY